MAMRKKISIRGLPVLDDSVPITGNLHRKNCLADNKENY